MKRITDYSKKSKRYFIKTECKPWSLDYWDLVDIIGKLEDKLKGVENVINK